MDETSAPARPLFDRIESIRANAGMTKTRLAEITGLPRATIDRWQDQPRPPLPESVMKVADALGINRDEALRLAGILDGVPPPMDRDAAVADLRAKLAEISAASAEIERRLAELEGKDRRPKAG
jgi:transcriptional regulator with XRE-family HTH domain